MEYICNICNKKYKTYQSLWIHNKKFHLNKSNNNSKLTLDNSKLTLDNSSITPNNTNKYVCENCGKFYKYSQGKWKHKQTCSEIKYSNIKNIETEIIELKKEVNNLKNNKIINNGTVVNGNIINGNIIQSKINETGHENILELNDKEVTDIFNKEIEGVIKLIELVNFNERLPLNHSFCTTALDSQYVSTYNSETKSIDKDRKKYFFDSIFSKAIERQEILYKNNKNKFEESKRIQIEENIDFLKKIKNSDFNNKILKEFMKKINLLSYNKRQIVQNTWLQSQPDTDNYFLELANEEEKNIKDIIYNCGNLSENYESSSEMESSDDSELYDGKVLIKSVKKNKNINL